MSGQQLHPLSNAEPSSGSLKPDSSGSSSTSFANTNSAGDSGPHHMSGGVDSHLHSSPRTLGPEHSNKRAPSTLKQPPFIPQRGARPTSEILKPGNYAN